MIRSHSRAISLLYGLEPRSASALSPFGSGPAPPKGQNKDSGFQHVAVASGFWTHFAKEGASPKKVQMRMSGQLWQLSICMTRSLLLHQSLHYGTNTSIARLLRRIPKDMTQVGTGLLYTVLSVWGPKKAASKQQVALRSSWWSLSSAGYDADELRPQ